MLDVVIERLAAVFSIPAEAAFRTLLSMLVVYCCTMIPLLCWGLPKLLQGAQVWRLPTISNAINIFSALESLQHVHVESCSILQQALPKCSLCCSEQQIPS